MEALTETMTEEDIHVVMEEDAANSDDPVEPVLLHGIYREEVFNDVDDLIGDTTPSPSNATQDTPLKQRGGGKDYLSSRKDHRMGSKREA
jgi:hypothetical protein